MKGQPTKAKANRVKPAGKLATLRDAVERYIELSPGLKRGPTYRHRVNCWARYVPCDLPIISARLNSFRRAASDDHLSPATIEGVISDVLTILRGTDQVVPKRGRALKKPAPKAKQPSREDIGKVYAVVSQAVYPALTFIGPKGTAHNKANREHWKRWTLSERERFWRALLCLGFWTGLRISDLRQLQWSSVFADRIEWQASKTGAPHVFPITHDVQRHLDMARGLDGVFVFPLPKGSVRFVRRELARLCNAAKVEHFGPQMIRRASVTEWSTTSNDAGTLIHGCGLGVRRFYVNPLPVLARAAPNFRLPVEMRDQEPPPDTQIEELVATLKSLRREEVDSLLRMSKALFQP